MSTVGIMARSSVENTGEFPRLGSSRIVRRPASKGSVAHFYQSVQRVFRSLELPLGTFLKLSGGQ